MVSLHPSLYYSISLIAHSSIHFLHFRFSHWFLFPHGLTGLNLFLLIVMVFDFLVSSTLHFNDNLLAYQYLRHTFPPDLSTIFIHHTLPPFYSTIPFYHTLSLDMTFLILLFYNTPPPYYSSVLSYPTLLHDTSPTKLFHYTLSPNLHTITSPPYSSIKLFHKSPSPLSFTIPSTIFVLVTTWTPSTRSK